MIGKKDVSELCPGDIIPAPSPRQGHDGVTVSAVEIISNELAGGGGFFAIRRMRLRNVHPDGSRSSEMLLDYMERPKGLDAVAVAIWARPPGPGEDVRVLLRSGLRFPVFFGRPISAQPIPDPAPRLMVQEIVAGIVETGECGLDALRQRAADEVREEAGFRVAPEAIEILGNGVLLSPGALPEKCFLAAVEVDPMQRGAIAGDGSAMEEGSFLSWIGLSSAIAACVDGDIDDAKTELALRRLAERLHTRGLFTGHLP